MNARTLATSLAVIAALLSASCAQDLDLIDRVQPNKIKKKDVLGKEYYLQQMVVGTTFTAARAFPGATASTVRGVFEFQEKSLFFYRTYEVIAGSDVYVQKSDADTPMKDKDGNIVKRATLQDFMSVLCTKDTAKDVCASDAWCANAADPKMGGEGDFHGRCVREGVRYVYRGSPIQSYPVSSHFDVKRNYSAATGEQSNV